ncbi:LOW QUALITY PROTEIN: E3 ubiquitin-protein ligase ATL4-like [Curcuma longa]|uniref:LOW QUALITY PROTEIN: E3 ubiquitin-protein ligase ATL4-like n=1 Tax=Curcuma longa TaxID=136217 RepID=UPI003D9E1E3E
MDSDSRPSPLPPLWRRRFSRGQPPSARSSSSSSSSPYLTSLKPSLFVIAAIIAAVVVASLSIQLLFRFLSSRRRSNSLVAAVPLAVVDPLSSSSTTGAAESDGQANAVALIDTLPVFTLASALASLPKSTPDCAVCLCPFRPDDELRLLPACRHAFHSSCVVPWLQTTPSCPLCRSSIAFPAPPLTLPTAPPITRDRSSSRSGSFRIEIGNVSHRRTLSAEYPPMPPPPPAPLPTQSHQRTYSIGSSFEYTVEEEVEAVVSRITRSKEKVKKRRDESGSTEPAAEPGDAVAAAAGGGGGRSEAEGWLKDYVDRLTSSASSSLSSRIFSGRWSYRCDGDGGGAGRNSWDLEASARREAEEGGYYGFYQWLIGA